MSPRIRKNPSLSLFNSHFCGLFVLLAMVFSSCNNSNKQEAVKQGLVVFSKQFQPIFDSTEHLFQLNRVDEALHYLDSSTHTLSNLTATDLHKKYQFHYVALNKVKHENEKALLYADSMIQASAQLANHDSYVAATADAFFAKADALFELGRYAESYSSYYQGYLVAQSGLDNCTLSAYSYRLGMITYKQANYKQAVTYFKENLRQSTVCTDDFAFFFRRQEVLDNIALSYKSQNKLDSAIYYFNEALKYIDANTGKFKDRANIMDAARAVVWGNEADVLSTKGRNDEAIKLLKKSIAVNLKKGNDNHDAHLSEVKLGQIYQSRNQNNELLPLMKQLRAQLDSLPSADAEAGYNLIMGNYYRSNNNFVAALPYVDRFHRIKDSLGALNRSLKANNVSEQMSSLDKQNKIVALRDQQRILKWAAIIFACMSTIIILLVYRNWRRSQSEMGVVNKLNQQVNAQKEDLEKTLDELRVSAQEKDRILRTVAHDLRNPLGGVASLTSAMIEDTDYNNEQLELLRIIKETAFDSLELINEILEATNTSNTELNKQLVDINLLLNNSVELMRFKAAEKNQKIMLNVLEAPEELLISREKIWRVISNLISNAIKFSPVGADIRVDLVKEDDHVLISVNDHGIGIPEENKTKVFNMFTDAKRPGTLGEKSFGLGLSICRQIIERHDGKIWFESSTNQGTTFFVELGTNSDNKLVAVTV